MDNHSPVGISLQIRDERGALHCGVHCRIPGYFPTVCIHTPTAEKCDVEHICFHSVRLLRGPSFGYPEHSNWQRGFWQCSNFTGFTHPQTNKQTNKHDRFTRQFLSSISPALKWPLLVGTFGFLLVGITNLTN
jgi:hypothetical protein